MTDDKQKPNDVVDGFDLPGGEPTPPPEGAPAAKAVDGFDLPADTAVPPPFTSAVGQPAGVEPHVRKEERRKKESVTGKLIALVGIPLVAILAIVLLREMRRQPLMAYEAECVKTAETFLKALSDSTEESVPAAVKLLRDDVQRTRDSETVTKDYELAAGNAKFKSLSGVTWDPAVAEVAASSFSAVVQIESGSFSAWFDFSLVKSGEGTAPRITNYMLGYPSACIPAAAEFLKGLSANTPESTAAACALLDREFLLRKARETVASEYRTATSELGRFKFLGEATWDKTPNGSAALSFEISAQFEGGSIPLRFSFLPEVSGGKPRVRIKDYAFPAK